MIYEVGTIVRDIRTKKRWIIKEITENSYRIHGITKAGKESKQDYYMPHNCAEREEAS